MSLRTVLSTSALALALLAGRAHAATTAQICATSSADMTLSFAKGAEVVSQLSGIHYGLYPYDAVSPWLYGSYHGSYCGQEAVLAATGFRAPGASSYGFFNVSYGIGDFDGDLNCSGTATTIEVWANGLFGTSSNPGGWTMVAGRTAWNCDASSFTFTLPQPVCDDDHCDTPSVYYSTQYDIVFRTRNAYTGAAKSPRVRATITAFPVHSSQEWLQLVQR
jgi:hypothetical protein